MAQDGIAPTPGAGEIVPLPEPFADPQVPAASQPDPMMPLDGVTGPARQRIGDGAAAATISGDLDALPEPVRQMRTMIMDAAESGDLERLLPLLGSGAERTQLSLGEPYDDPLEFLRSISGDSQGHEILAILIEVLEADYAHMDAGLDSEIYVWPSFVAMRLDTLSAEDRVDLFKLVTAGDLQDMMEFGAYIFFRVGITPQGRWVFFIAGD